MGADKMNKFDRAVNKKTSELITKNLLNQEVDEEIYKKYEVIARAMIREELREVKQSNNPKSLYRKTWKAAEKYRDLVK
jgi:hypothetical protein